MGGAGLRVPLWSVDKRHAGSPTGAAARAFTRPSRPISSA